MGLDVVTIIVVIFVFALVAWIGYTFLKDINTDLQADADLSADAKAVSSNITTRFPAIFDAGFMLILFLLWVAILISSYLIDTNPVFFMVSIIVFAIAILVAMAVNSGYSEMLTDSDFSSFSTDFPMSHFILNNIVWVTLIVGLSIGVVLYGKNRAGL